MDLKLPEHLRAYSREELLQWIRERWARLDDGVDLRMENPPKESGVDDLLRDMPDPQWLLDLPFTVYVRPFDLSLPFSWISNYAQVSVGRLPHELQSKEHLWLKGVHPQDRARVIQAFEGAEPGQVIELEYRFEVANQSYRYLMDRAVLKRSAADRDLFWVGAWMDVTQRKELEKLVADVTEQEKRRLGRELHDDVCQQLTSLEMLVHSMRKRSEQQGGLDPNRWQTLLDHVRTTIETTRSVTRGLSTAHILEQGLTSALRHWIHHLDSMLPLQVHFVGPTCLKLMDAQAAVHLYRIAQEAVQNTIRHASASNIWINLRVKGRDLHILIEDDGRGLDAIQDDPEPGLGIKNMEYRASLLHGSVCLEQRKGGGTRVICEIPFIVAENQ